MFRLVGAAFLAMVLAAASSVAGAAAIGAADGNATAAKAAARAGEAAIVLAQAATPYPGGKPIRLIVPFPPDTPYDTGLDVLVPALSKALGAPVETDHVGGMGGKAGWSALAEAAPDGRTIALMALPAALLHYADASRETPFTPKEFAPVAELWRADYAIAVRAESPIRDFADFLAAARAKPKGVMVADAGLLTVQHILTPLLESAAGIKVDTIHFYNGAPGATAALLGGHVDAMSASAEELVPLLAEKKVRVLAVAADDGSPLLPGVPTMRSLGVPLTYQSVVGLAAPAGTPPAILQVLEDAARMVLAEAETQKKLEDEKLVPEFRNRSDFADYWRRYDEAVGPAVRSVMQ